MRVYCTSCLSRRRWNMANKDVSMILWLLLFLLLCMCVWVWLLLNFSIKVRQAISASAKWLLESVDFLHLFLSSFFFSSWPSLVRCQWLLPSFLDASYTESLITSLHTSLDSLTWKSIHRPDTAWNPLSLLSLSSLSLSLSSLRDQRHYLHPMNQLTNHGTNLRQVSHQLTLTLDWFNWWIRLKHLSHLTLAWFQITRLN